MEILKNIYIGIEERKEEKEKRRKTEEKQKKKRKRERKRNVDFLLPSLQNGRRQRDSTSSGNQSDSLSDITVSSGSKRGHGADGRNGALKVNGGQLTNVNNVWSDTCQGSGGGILCGDQK